MNNESFEASNFPPISFPHLFVQLLENGYFLVKTTLCFFFLQGFKSLTLLFKRIIGLDKGTSFCFLYFIGKYTILSPKELNETILFVIFSQVTGVQ